MLNRVLPSASVIGLLVLASDESVCEASNAAFALGVKSKSDVIKIVVLIAFISNLF